MRQSCVASSKRPRRSFACVTSSGTCKGDRSKWWCAKPVPATSCWSAGRSVQPFGPLLRLHGNLLFVNEPWESGSSIVVLCEDQDAVSGRALAIARRIADVEGLPLLLATRDSVESNLADRIVHVTDWSEAEIAALCEAQDARLLVLSSLEQLDWQLLVPALAERLPCSLLRLEA
jgi:hypothetical protein